MKHYEGSGLCVRNVTVTDDYYERSGQVQVVFYIELKINSYTYV